MLEAIRAVFLGAIPVALFTFLILQWSIASGRMSKFSGEEKLHHQHRSQAKKSRKSRPKKRSYAVGDLFHSKIISFGGGFYGTMAVLTYILVEALEILQFLQELLDPITWANKLGLDALIDFFVSSLMNLVAAFVWFETLQDYISINNGFIWLGAAYVGYLAGLRVTSEKGDVIWSGVHSFIEAKKKGK